MPEPEPEPYPSQGTKVHLERQVELLRRRLDVFYINLDARTDRRDQMEATLCRYGISTSCRAVATEDTGQTVRVRATTPADASVAALLEEYPQKRGSQTACSQSHISVWERIAAETDDARLCLILEDDVRFHKQWLRGLYECLSVSKGWGVFYLDAFDQSGWDFSATKFNKRRDGIDAQFDVLPARHCLFADAYLLTPVAARELLRMREAEPWKDHEGLLLVLQGDELDENEGEGGAERAPIAFTALPRLALQRWDDSDNQQSGQVKAFAEFYATQYHSKFPDMLYDP